VQRVIKQWIEEYKIDGFRWDLTKGFTQNVLRTLLVDKKIVPVAQQDRVDVLKNMLIILGIKSLCYF
jgi:pullulanase/glycogen debranching enzyme